MGFDNLNLFSFRLSPLTDREDGVRLSYHFSRHFPDVVVVWKDGLFFGLAKQGRPLPTDAEWIELLAYIQRQIFEFSESTTPLQAAGYGQPDLFENSLTLQAAGNEPSIGFKVAVSAIAQSANYSRYCCYICRTDFECKPTFQRRDGAFRAECRGQA